MGVKGTIRYTTTGMIISPYTKGQSIYLEKLTSTYDRVTHKWTPLTGYTIENEDLGDSIFITHLNSKSFIQGIFPEYTIESEPKAKVKKIHQHFTLNADVTPTDVQYDIIQSILANDQMHQWFVYLSQGFGKTLLSIYLSSLFNVKTLIMCYSKDILKQWVASLKDRTTINLKRVLTIDSSKLLLVICNGSFPAEDYDVFLCTPGLITSFGKRYGYDKISQLMKTMGIGFKIFDEAHRNIANIIKINAYSNVDRTLYLSGDFAQSNPRKEVLYKRIFHNVPIIKPEEELMNTLKYTEAIVVEYDSEPSTQESMSVYTRRGFSSYNFMKYQFSTTIFFDTLDFIIGHINKSNTNNYKVLVLANLIDHVESLYDQLHAKYSDKYILGKFHGELTDSEKDFAKTTATMIVASYQSFGTGLDVTDIKYVISTTACTKVDDNQASGRARPLSDGSNCFYFMMCDKGFAYVMKTLKFRLAYLEETKIKKITRIRY